jgi:hypothetical protein
MQSIFIVLTFFYEVTPFAHKNFRIFQQIQYNRLKIISNFNFFFLIQTHIVFFCVVVENIN